MLSVNTVARALVYVSGTSCTYAGTPAAQNVAIAFPITPADYDITTLVSYSSNDASATACPLNQIIWY